MMLRVLLFLGIITIPTSFDYTVYMVSPDEYSGWAGGIMVTVSDLLFLGVFFLWKLRDMGRLHPVPGKVLFWKPAALFLAACVISLINSVWRIYSVFEIFQFCKVVFLYYYVTLKVVESEEDLHWIVYGLMGILVLQSVLAAVQFVTQDYHDFLRTGMPSNPTPFGDILRSQGTVGSPNGLSAVLTPILLLAVSRLLSEEKRNRLAYAAVLMTGLVGLVVTFSRTGWLVFMLATFVLIMARSRRVSPAAAVSVVAVVGITMLLMSGLLTSRMTVDDEGSAMDRWYLMRIAFSIIGNNWLTGVGINNYWFAMNDYVPASYEWSFVYVVHNVFLLILAETGFVGLIAIILLFAVPIYRMAKLLPVAKGEISDTALWLVAALSGIAVMNMVDLTWSSPGMNSLYFLFLGIANSLVHLQYRRRTA